jgi:putative restriction endonuclease
MDRPELLNRLSQLRQAQVGNQRVPHKPLLLLWLFGRFATSGTTQVSYREAEEPVSRLINDFGPPVTSQSRARQRAAMPFVHLERELWELCDAHGRELGPEVPERRSWLLDHEAIGRLRPEAEQLLADPATLAAAARQLLELHFTPTLASLICDAVDLDLAALEASSLQPPPRGRRPRRPGFAEEVLRAYGYACAVCGFDGALGRNPVAIEAAHIRWHSQQGPDEVANALALCTLHHALLDLGVLGVNLDLHVLVSPLYVARTPAGQAIHAFAGGALRRPQPGQPAPAAAHLDWHGRLVFKGDVSAA